MQIIITGGAGFLGQRLAKELLNSELYFDQLLLVDILKPSSFSQDKRLKCLQLDLSLAGAADSILGPKTGIIFHLAAIVSSHAEMDFDLGWKVNLDLSRKLLESSRKYSGRIKFVFASSLAVYGGDLPAIVSELTAVKPGSSYGAQKAMAELLVNDYSRKGFIDGRVLRLPTVCIRPGKPNLAASSFVSSIIREPLFGEKAICPVSGDLELWLSSPDTIIKNILKASQINKERFGDCLTVNLPGISVKVKEMIQSLERMTDKETVNRIQFEFNEAIHAIVSTWPGRLDNSRALNLGLKVDKHFDDFISQFQLGMK